MNILLDTNALIWILDQTDGRSFGKNALDKINTADIVYSSSISILEIRIKTMLGKLKSEEDLSEDIILAGIKSLSFSSTHADAITKFPNLSKHDPFDRMLLAQALTENLIFLTSDSLLIELNLPFIIDTRK